MCRLSGLLNMNKIDRNKLKKGKKYLIVDKYENREYIGIITVLFEQNCMINILTSYDYSQMRIPHIGNRFIIAKLYWFYEMVPEAQRQLEIKSFDIVMNDLIPGFNIKYL